MKTQEVLWPTGSHSQYYKGGRSAPHEYLVGNQGTGHVKLNLVEAHPASGTEELNYPNFYLVNRPQMEANINICRYRCMKLLYMFSCN